jgi:hypothetical protein
MAFITRQLKLDLTIDEPYTVTGRDSIITECKQMYEKKWYQFGMIDEITTIVNITDIEIYLDLDTTKGRCTVDCIAKIFVITVGDIIPAALVTMTANNQVRLEHATQKYMKITLNNERGDLQITPGMIIPVIVQRIVVNFLESTVRASAKLCTEIKPFTALVTPTDLQQLRKITDQQVPQKIPKHILDLIALKDLPHVKEMKITNPTVVSFYVNQSGQLVYNINPFTGAKPQINIDNLIHYRNMIVNLFTYFAA